MRMNHYKVKIHVHYGKSSSLLSKLKYSTNGTVQYTNGQTSLKKNLKEKGDYAFVQLNHHARDKLQGFSRAQVFLQNCSNNVPSTQLFASSTVSVQKLSKRFAVIIVNELGLKQKIKE